MGTKEKNGLVSFDMCEGNPGALTFMMAAYSPNKNLKELLKTESAFGRMRKFGITGAKLYMLWNDCCDRDTDKAIQIMRTNDIDDILKHINYEGGRGIPYEE